MGLGFFRSWITLLTGADVVVGLNGLVHDAALSAILVVIALLARASRPLFESRRALATCLAMALCASVLAILGAVFQAGLGWAGATVAVLAACASGLFILMWSDLYSRLSATDTALALALAMLVALTIVAGLTLFDGESLARRWGVRILGRGKMAEDSRGRELLFQACEAAACEHGLMSRELEVLTLLAQGRPSADICSELNVAKGTFKAHCEHIYVKMGVRSKKELLQALSQPGASPTVPGAQLRRSS